MTPSKKPCVEAFWPPGVQKCATVGILGLAFAAVHRKTLKNSSGLAAGS